MSTLIDPNCAMGDHTWRGGSACHCGARLRCGCGRFIREGDLDHHIASGSCPAIPDPQCEDLCMERCIGACGVLP